MINTKEAIEQRILDRIPDNIDKREGEVTQTTVGPISVELEETYMAVDTALDEIFPDTQSRPFLLRDAFIRKGIVPFPATFAVVGGYLTGTYNPDNIIGQRFFSNDIPFVVTRKLSEDEINEQEESEKYNYELTGEVSGQRGNQNNSILVPFQAIAGLETATLIKIIVNAQDEEDTESFRTRYIDYLRGDAWGGNKLDYYHKVSEFTGDKRNKVFRSEDRGGYFDILILDANYNLPSPEFIDYVQQKVDPSDNPGGGDGIAGIGQKPIVKAPDAITINVNIPIIQFRLGFSQNWTDHAEAITAVIEEYMLNIRMAFYNMDRQTVFISQISNRIGDMPQVLNIEGVTLNGVANNIILNEKQIPILGTVTNE